ncbi:MAG: O-antigen ligase family protein [Chloroflexi bacterium]|nr:O-antigen ligase family protein [Chloroflexota bacterium]
MPTKLSRFCDGVMEAGWLSAVIVVPLFFDIYSSRVFEPDKLAFLRTIALVVVAAWLVKIIEEGGPRFDHVTLPPTSDLRPLTSILRLPLIAPVFALLVSLLLSTVLSVTPRVSFFGSYQRLQGTYTTLAYLVLFGSILANMRRRAQFDRLITAVILTGLPVSLYGMLQRFQLDPLPWGGDTVTRVSSTLGNPILLGAYLIMVLPITIGRVVESFGAIMREAEGLVYHLIRATLYVFIASADLIALWLTGSRGPWLGFLAGSFFLLILLSSHWRLRWLTIGTIALAAVLGVSLIVLNIPNGPLEPLRASPSLGRLGHVFETDKETGRVRVLIWQGASELVRPHAPLEYPDGHQDAFNFLRPLVGYGPESMYVAFNRFYPPELGQIERRNATPDRSHNETWDALVTTGVLGLLVYLALFASILYYGVKWLGLIQSARQRNLFIGLYAGGGLAGAIALVAWQGLPFFGVGLPFGIMLGLIAYLTLLAIFAPPASVGTRLAPWRAIALSTLIAALHRNPLRLRRRRFAHPVLDVDRTDGRRGMRADPGK